eukprot:scaffold302_cov421-Pavlova_lutheri.AAC.4
MHMGRTLFLGIEAVAMWYCLGSGVDSWGTVRQRSARVPSSPSMQHVFWQSYKCAELQSVIDHVPGGAGLVAVHGPLVPVQQRVLHSIPAGLVLVYETTIHRRPEGMEGGFPVSQYILSPFGPLNASATVSARLRLASGLSVPACFMISKSSGCAIQATGKALPHIRCRAASVTFKAAVSPTSMPMPSKWDTSVLAA